MSLPPVPPDVVAEGVEALPARLRRRLDDAVAKTRSWPVTASVPTVLVTAGEDATVTLTVPVLSPSDVVCSCLLAPACLHRAAVLSLAPAGDSPAPPPSVAGEEPPAETGEEPPPEETGELTDAEQAAVEAAWRAGGDLLAAGVTGAGSVYQAVLLRAAHDARAAGLPRLGSAAVRVVRRLRAARAEEADFRLADLVDDVRELLGVAYGLRTGHGDSALLRGRARRDYRPVGNLRLYGLCCETLVAASGYAGAVTHLVDDAGRLWQLGGVTPGGPSAATGRSEALVGIGEARLTYRALARAGLRVINAAASVDGRLSSGVGVSAVAADGVDWFTDPVARLWRPLSEQLERCRAALATTVAQRSGGYDLLFLDGVVAGATDDAVTLNVEGTTIALTAPNAMPELPYVDNLRRLAGAVGAPVRMIGRYAGPATVQALAIAAPWLPAPLDLGVDTLRAAQLPSPGVIVSPVVAPAPPPPLHLLTRRLERCVEGGRTAAVGRTDDARRLRAAQLHTAAALAERVDEEAGRVRRDHFGRLAPDGNEALAMAWLAAAVYTTAFA
jgi:hypothetical protein